jgi:hypothetical protein
MILTSFEQWATAETDYDLTRVPGGFGYQSANTQHAFNGWLACAVEIMRTNTRIWDENDYGETSGLD